jgi:hypothetical protein
VTVISRIKEFCLTYLPRRFSLGLAEYFHEMLSTLGERCCRRWRFE